MDIEKLKAQMTAHLRAAKAIAKAAEDERREFTDEERKKVEAHLGEIRLLQKQIDEADPDSAHRRKQLDKEGFRKAVAEQFGEDFADVVFGTKSSGAGRMGAGVWSDRFMKALPYQPGSGRKDLLPPSGSVSAGRLSDTIGTLDDDGRPSTMLQLIPIEPIGGDSFSYLRETVRDQQARPVAIGEKKPTSTYTLERVDDRVRTIAHLSEPIPRNWLADAPMLRQYIDMNLRAGVVLELEYQVLQGSGTGEELPGILNVANTLVQPFVTNILVTTRKAVTYLETRPVMPTGWIMHPSDWEAFELLVDQEGRYYWEGPTGSPVNASQRRLWGLPVALTLGMPEGTALVADWRTAVTLLEREETRIDWSEAFHIAAGAYDESDFTGFESNQIKFRGEGRWGLQINRPNAVCEVALIEGS